MLTLDDTIAAVASAPGGGARAIVRISGPGMRACVEGLGFRTAEGASGSQGAAPQALAGSVSLAGLDSALPCDLYCWPTARSYTRQPSAELHTIGSPPLVELLLRAVCQAGARLARPGEFTLRAFLAGRLDLTQAEAVLGVIDAADRRSLEVALAQLAGGLARPLAQLRGDLLDLLAHLEAGLDFVEEDIRFIAATELERDLALAAAAVAQLAERLASRGESGEMPRAVLVGLPNVGKSSLFNALAGRERRLVSPQAGTTRDYLTADLDLTGVACRLVDTAGRETAAAGLSAAAQQLRDEQDRAAHVRLLCLDSTRLLTPEEREWLDVSFNPEPTATFLVLLTKCDAPRLLAPLNVPAIERRGSGVFFESAGSSSPILVVQPANPKKTPDPFIPIETSSVTGLGIGLLRERLRATLLSAAACQGELVAATAVRVGDSLRLATDALAQARDLARSSAGDELVAAELRLALDELGQVAGAVYTDDLLDRIFSRFCIGK